MTNPKVEEVQNSEDVQDVRNRSQVLKKQFFKKKRICPFMGSSEVIDYKDIKLLSKFVSERGKIIPSRVTGVSNQKQRELSKAIKRARFLALMPYVSS